MAATKTLLLLFLIFSFFHIPPPVSARQLSDNVAHVEAHLESDVDLNTVCGKYKKHERLYATLNDEHDIKHKTKHDIKEDCRKLYKDEKKLEEIKDKGK